MKLLATCQTLGTLEALERNRQAEINKRKVSKSVYSDTSPRPRLAIAAFTGIVMLLPGARQPSSVSPASAAALARRSWVVTGEFSRFLLRM
jgi:hypothetical protein